MPTYAYRCDTCETTTDRVKSITRVDSPEQCETCGDQLTRLFSPGTVIGAIGAHSTNPNVERFLETGEPLGLRRSDPNHIY